MHPSRAVFEFHLRFPDFVVIGLILLLLVAIGVACHRMVTTTRDFFVGGNRMSWWLAGTSVFMAGFSAWTFTGAAGLAYTNGHVAILYFFLGQGLGFFFGALFIAHRCRQTRTTTTMEIVRDRYGRATEQAVVALQILSAVPMGAVWLTGLALFFSVAFAVPMAPCIIVAGTIILIYSTLGGSWAVALSDFFQGVLLLMMVLLVAGLSFGAIGGFSGLAEHVPERVRVGFSEEHDVFWLLAGGAMAFLNFASIAPGARYLAVRDGRAARKVALLACGLFLIGPALWFLPPITATYFYPDLGATLPSLKHPQEGAYIVMGLAMLPPGLAGLLLMNIFGATLTTLDAAVNQTSGFLTLNVYRTWIRQRASEREMVVVARVFSVLFGIVVMTLALALAGSEKHGLLDLNLNLQSIIAIPMLVPFFLMWFVRRAPRWSALVTMSIGVLVSYALNKNVFWPDLVFNIEPMLARFAGVEAWPAGEPFPFAVRVAGTLGACVLVFFFTCLFWRREPIARRESVRSFYAVMDRPVEAEREVPGKEDPQQFLIGGMLLIIVGCVLFGLGFIGVASDRSAWITVAFGSVAALGGACLRACGRSQKRREQISAKAACEDPPGDSTPADAVRR